jgi:hypothetical protein
MSSYKIIANIVKEQKGSNSCFVAKVMVNEYLPNHNYFPEGRPDRPDRVRTLDVILNGPGENKAQEKIRKMLKSLRINNIENTYIDLSGYTENILGKDLLNTIGIGYDDY